MSAHGDHDMGHTVAAGRAPCSPSPAPRWPARRSRRAPPPSCGRAWHCCQPPPSPPGCCTSPSWGKATGPRPPGRRDWRLRDAHARHGHPDCLGCRLALPRTPRTRSRSRSRSRAGRPRAGAGARSGADRHRAGQGSVQNCVVIR
ncbi:HGxxPAAW family protein [Kitasatospora arboriphila]